MLPAVVGSNQGGEIEWDVFLAHASPDKPRVRVLYDALVARGLRVCFDETSLKPGDVWPKLLPKNLASSAVIVVGVSDASEAAHYEIEEIAQAIELYRSRGVRVIPVWLDEGAEPPYGLRSFNRIEHFDDTGVGSVADAIAEMVGVERTARERRISTGLTRPIFSPQIPALPVHFADPHDLIGNLWATVESGGTKVLTQSISGLGGVGKTTAAAALCARARGRLDIVWWIRSEDQATLVADLAALAQELGLADATDTEAAAVAVVRWLSRSDLRWLLVFDNAVDEPTIDVWRPKTGSGLVVVTSRNRNMNRLGEVIPLDVWPDEVADEFLRSRVVGRNPKAATGSTQAILQRLGGLPLAIEQAAAWVERIKSRTFDRYVELFDRATVDAFPDTTRPLDYEQTALTTWRVSIDAAETESRGATRVMEVVCQFATTGLPMAWVVEASTFDEGYLAHLGSEEIEAALVSLDGYSLLTITEDEMIEVHRLVRAAVSATASPAALTLATEVLEAVTPGAVQTPTNWSTLGAIAPHLQRMLDRSGELDDLSVSTICTLARRIVAFEDARGNVASAILTGTTGFELAQNRLGPDHPVTLDAANALATAYHSAGNLDAAIPLFQATHETRVRVLGPDADNTLASANNLATAYQSAGRLDLAMQIHEATLEATAQRHGPDHVDTLTSTGNLAQVYQAAGDLDRAIPLFEHTRDTHLRTLGPDDRRTLISANNLATAYDAAGRLADAVPLLEANHRSRERVLGSDHPDTLLSANNLAAAYEASGDLDRAIPLHEANYETRIQVLGPDHPSTLISANNLAYALQLAGRLDDAIPLLERTHADRLRVLGPNHPDTLSSAVNLASALRENGHNDQALPIDQATYAAMTNVLGPEHPFTLVSASNLAVALEVAGDLTQAIELLEATLPRKRIVFGLVHQSTVATIQRLLHLYASVGRHEDARRLAESVEPGT